MSSDRDFMKKILIIIFACFVNGHLLFGQNQVRVENQPAGQTNVNYDETKVGNYTIPTLLKTGDGKPVHTVQRWSKNRRAILQDLKSSPY